MASVSASENALDLFLCSPKTWFTGASTVTGLDRMVTPVQGGPFDLRYVGVQKSD
jgi:peptide/nickel transport system substrate-binding protein